MVRGHGNVAWLSLLGAGLFLIGMAISGSMPAALADNDNEEAPGDAIEEGNDEAPGDSDAENGNDEEEGEANGEVRDEEDGEVAGDEIDETADEEIRLRMVADPAAIRLAELVGEEIPATSVQPRRLDDAPRVRPFLNGEADFVLTASPLTRDETLRVVERLHRAPLAYPLAIDVLAVYVREGNRVERIDHEQLRSIYEGEITNWNELGGPDRRITPYLPRLGSDTYSYVVNEMFPDIRLSGDVRFADSSADIARAIRQSGDNSGAIGIGSLASHQDVVRVLPVAEHERAQHFRPVEEHVASGDYPYRRVIFAYTLDRPTGKTKEWIEAAQDRLQEQLMDHDYFPLTIAD